MNRSNEADHLTARIPETLAGRRLDQVLAVLFPRYSRSRLQQWIGDGLVRVDSRQLRARDKVAGGELVEVTVLSAAETPWAGQSMPLEIVYQDAALLVLNKPPGIVVHPAAGHRDGTLVNALLHYAPELARVPRAGIVHRLDKDTSGLMVIARTLEAHTRLVDQLQRRLVRREYLALVYGELVAGGRIEAPLGRHPLRRQRMAVIDTGKQASTQYRVLERYKGFTLIRVTLETGRTHQIRVHMAHIRHPVAGDPVYGRLRVPKGAGERLVGLLRGFRRQALHAERLTLTHPLTDRTVRWRVPPPQDMARLLDELKTHYTVTD